jgi:hypothetical protein
MLLQDLSKGIITELVVQFVDPVPDVSLRKSLKTEIWTSHTNYFKKTKEEHPISNKKLVKNLKNFFQNKDNLHDLVYLRGYFYVEEDRSPNLDYFLKDTVIALSLQARDEASLSECLQCVLIAVDEIFWKNLESAPLSKDWFEKRRSARSNTVPSKRSSKDVESRETSQVYEFNVSDVNDPVVREAIQILNDAVNHKDLTYNLEASSKIDDMRHRGYLDNTSFAELHASMLYQVATFGVTDDTNAHLIQSSMDAIEKLRSEGFSRSRHIAEVYSSVLNFVAYRAANLEQQMAVIDKLDALRNEGFSENTQIAEKLANALANIPATTPDLSVSQRITSRLEALYSEGFQKVRLVRESLVRALFAAVKYEPDINKKHELIEKIENVRKAVPMQNEAINLNYLKAMAEIVQGSTSAKEFSRNLGLADRFLNEVPRLDDESTLLMMQILHNCAVNSPNGEACLLIEEKMEKLQSKGFASNDEMTRLCVNVLEFCFTYEANSELCLKAAQKINALRNNKRPNYEAISERYALALSYVAGIEEDLEKTSSIINTLEDLHKKSFPSNQEITAALSQAIFTHCSNDHDFDSALQSARKIQVLYKEALPLNWELADELVVQLLDALIHVLAHAPDKESAAKLLDQIFEIFHGIDPQKQGKEDIAEYIAVQFMSIGESENDPKTRTKFADKIEMIYNDGFENNEKITVALARALSNSSERNEERDDCLVLADRVNALRSIGREEHEELAVMYAKALLNSTAYSRDSEAILQTAKVIEKLRIEHFKNNKYIIHMLSLALLSAANEMTDSKKIQTVADRIDALRYYGFEAYDDLTQILISVLKNLCLYEPNEDAKNAVQMRIDALQSSLIENDDQV